MREEVALKMALPESKIQVKKYKVKMRLNQNFGPIVVAARQA